jgi:TM2 domain-containing membrane protein YozV
MTAPAVCPYCRMAFDESAPPRIFCTACGMPHHEDCYQENGGCTVFGCPRAPADDPKLQVSYGDLNAVSAGSSQIGPAATAATPQASAPLPQFHSPYSGPLGLSQPATAPAQPSPPPVAGAASVAPQLPDYAYALPAHLRPEAQGRPPRSRTTYIVLGIFLGAFGGHNFYAGYTGRAVGQLCLSVLTLFYLAIVSWIWAIVEICIVDKDNAGIQFT